MTQKISRRSFTRAGAAATLGLTAAQASKVIGANDRVRLGFIGVANRGGQLLSAFSPHEDKEIVAMCDICSTTLEKANQKWTKGKADTCSDFRELIDRKDIDAVVIATPDHWHAIQTITACDAKKDVYIEKPLSATIHEGRRMVIAARRNKRVVQVGLHRRSAKIYAQCADLVGSDKIGKVTVSRMYHRSNMYPAGMGHAQPTAPPKDLDWNMWLGPRPERPYQENIAPYKFRWWKKYSSQIANNGVHFLDLSRWVTGDEAPTSICAMGGNFAVDDDRTIPDTMHTVFELPSGRILIIGIYEANGNPTMPEPGYVEWRGTQGTLYAYDKSYKIVPERGGQFQSSKPRMKPIEVPRNEGNHTTAHARNFLDCIKSRELPHADVEIGHRSTSFSLLANISLALRERLEWDPVKEVFLNNDAANSMLHYEYRKPWKLG